MDMRARCGMSVSGPGNVGCDMPSIYIPKPKTKEMPCRRCSEPITVGWKTKKLPVHPECSQKALYENIYAMHNRSGPEYDKWLKAYRAALERLESGGHPPPENVTPDCQ